jgi:cytochrome c-type protein NapB
VSEPVPPHAPPPEEPVAPSAEAILPGPVRRHAALFAVIGLGIALVGYIRGVRDVPLPPPPPPPGETPALAAPPAPKYAEVPTAPIRANAGWKSDLANLKFAKPGVFDAVERTEEMKLTALADRAKNRAYDGAPPTIPHAVDATSAASCLACHGQGLKVGDRVATRVSHPHYAGCTQCHVESARSGLAVALDMPGNGFDGTYRAGPGGRAGPGAPPTIPHTTWMRQDCAACHGLVTRAGLRTTHPWLTNCTQCHAPSAALDQVAFPF